MGFYGTLFCKIGGAVPHPSDFDAPFLALYNVKDKNLIGSFSSL